MLVGRVTEEEKRRKAFSGRPIETKILAALITSFTRAQRSDLVRGLLTIHLFTCIPRGNRVLVSNTFLRLNHGKTQPAFQFTISILKLYESITRWLINVEKIQVEKEDKNPLHIFVKSPKSTTHGNVCTHGYSALQNTNTSIPSMRPMENQWISWPLIFLKIQTFFLFMLFKKLSVEHLFTRNKFGASLIGCCSCQWWWMDE